MSASQAFYTKSPVQNRSWKVRESEDRIINNHRSSSDKLSVRKRSIKFQPLWEKHMASKSPTTIAEYIEAAPSAGQSHLRELYTLLKSVAPEAEETIKWNTPFFIEPRFLFAFSAHQAHLGFCPMAEALEPFRKELTKYEITRMGVLKIPYSESLPKDLIRRIAEHRLQMVSDRDDVSFW